MAPVHGSCTAPLRGSFWPHVGHVRLHSLAPFGGRTWAMYGSTSWLLLVPVHGSSTDNFLAPFGARTWVMYGSLPGSFWCPYMGHVRLHFLAPFGPHMGPVRLHLLTPFGTRTWVMYGSTCWPLLAPRGSRTAHLPGSFLTPVHGSCTCQLLGSFLTPVLGSCTDPL